MDKWTDPVDMTSQLHQYQALGFKSPALSEGDHDSQEVGLTIHPSLNTFLLIQIVQPWSSYPTQT